MNWLKQAEEEYRGEHGAPGREGASADDLTQNGVYPADVYIRPDWYESNDGLKELYKITRLRGRPDARVWIHRAIPKSAYAAGKSISSGDWVSTSKEYARGHGESALNGDFKICSRIVRAREIYTNGDSIFEWGYAP